MAWIVPAGARTQWILWLNGAAGAGKSAIGRSIVELCSARDIPIARFFFFRTDRRRNNITPVVATLAYQLLQLMPDLSAIITDRVRVNPLIFSLSLSTQFKSLIFEPLERLYRESSFSKPVVLLFDGVDECNDLNNEQEELIRIVGEFVVAHAIPVVAFFGSRAESQLKSAFRLPAVARSLLQLPLDNHYLPDNDIRLFVNDSFDKIKATHSFAHLLPLEWPTRADVEGIVDKSSGQFIYASVAMNFISDKRKHPGQQLDIIRGLRPSGRLAPFAQLDLLYHQIFAQVEDLACVTLILATLIFGADSHLASPKYFERRFGMEEVDVHVALGDLVAVVSCEPHAVKFLHASLPDFLLDRNRSGKYYIDRAAWSARLAETIIRHVQFKNDAPGMLTRLMLFDLGLYDLTFENEAKLLHLVSGYLAHADPTPELRKSILAFHLDQLYCDQYLDVAPVSFFLILYCCNYLDRLQKLVRTLLVGVQLS